MADASQSETRERVSYELTDRVTYRRRMIPVFCAYSVLILLILGAVFGLAKTVDGVSFFFLLMGPQFLFTQFPPVDMEFRRITVSEGGIAIEEGSQIWFARWNEFKAAIDRRTPWWHPSTRELLELRLNSGEVKKLPVDRTIAGRMPKLNELLADLERHGIPVVTR